MKIYRPGHCIFFWKSDLPPESTSCVMCVIYVLVMWITGKSILDNANKQFPLLNNAGVSFGILSSVQLINDNVEWSILPIKSSHQGSSKWKTKLF